MKRVSVNKGRAARAFGRSVNRTKGINMSMAPMRGGWRL